MSAMVESTLDPVLETIFAPAVPPTAAAPLAAVRELVARELAPKVVDVDLKAEYPEAFLRALGRIGGFSGVVEPAYGGSGAGILHTVQVMEEVAKTCLSSGFLVWCQTACARYIQMSDNEIAKRAYLPRIATGELLAGTGLSNTMKGCDEVEEYRLLARRVDGGYVINGVLPWVSNLGADHVFATGCPLDADGRLVFFVVDCSAPGFKLVDCAQFVALDGTRTLACHFKDTFVPDERVLAHAPESAAYLRRIKPGMILAQMGMGLGLIDACVELMRQSNRTHKHVNCYLDDQVEDLEAVLAGARSATYALCETLDDAPLADIVLGILKLRLAGGETALRAANAAMLHQGAKGYLKRNAAQRRLREAYFIAIVTPATKHLRKEVARLEAAAA
jgi:alkylation response protein AidB-like acyl-CoA dehydrogenase